MASETKLRDDRLYLVEGWGVCKYQADGDLFFSWSEWGESDLGTPASEETAYDLYSLPALYAALAAVEWGDTWRFVRNHRSETVHSAPSCPSCHGINPDTDLPDYLPRWVHDEFGLHSGHKVSCRLAAALAQARGEDA